jgi:hypothetical protein
MSVGWIRAPVSTTVARPRGYAALSRSTDKVLPDEWATREGGRQEFKWHRLPRWMFWRWRTPWARRVFDREDWTIEYATDVQVAREYMEKQYAREN